MKETGTISSETRIGKKKVVREDLDRKEILKKPHQKTIKNVLEKNPWARTRKNLNLPRIRNIFQELPSRRMLMIIQIRKIPLPIIIIIISQIGITEIEKSVMGIKNITALPRSRIGKPRKKEMFDP